MSARLLPEPLWDIQFAFPGKTRNHWRSVLVKIGGTEREAQHQAETMFNQPEYSEATDLLVVPLSES